MTDECLVEKARKECLCDNCKSIRYWEEMSLYMNFQKRVMDIFMESLKEKKQEEMSG